MKETRFKQTEIGLVPEDWKISRLGNYCNVNGRIGFRGYTTADLVSAGKGALTIGGKHITHNILDLSEPDYISWEKYYESPEIMVKPNDIVLAQRGSLGKSALIPTGIGAATINPSLVLLNAIKCNHQYLIYYLQSKIALDYILSINGQTSIPMISQTQIEAMDLLMPPMPEQRKIAEVLGDMDALLAELDKLIAKKRLIKQGAMQQLLTGRTRLKGFNEPWKVFSILDTFDFISNNTYSREQMSDDGNVKNIHYGDILVKYSDVLDLSKTQLPSIINLFTTDRPLKDGDIVIADTAEDETVGKAVEVINIGDYKVEAGLHTIALSPTIQFAKGFLGFYINSTVFHDQLLPYIQGIKVSSISKKAVSSLMMYVPSDTAEQHAIASILTDMDNEISELENKKAEYEKLKQGMMQQLLTGRIRLI